MALDLVKVWGGDSWRDDRLVVTPVVKTPRRVLPVKAAPKPLGRHDFKARGRAIRSHILTTLADGTPRTITQLWSGTRFSVSGVERYVTKLVQDGQVQVTGYRQGFGGRFFTVRPR